MEKWIYASKVFIFGFSGVFVGLILLMWAVQLTSFFVKMFSKKSQKRK